MGSPMSQASEISPEAVADGVFSVSLLSPARCRSVLDSVQDENHWEAAPIRKSVAGENRTVVEKNARNAESLGPNSHPRLLDEFEVVVKEQLLPFASRIFGVQVRDVRGTQLVRYRPGGYYHPHTDTTPSYFRTRYFTVLCYVNEDFQGGTTSFPLLDCEITPVTGRAVLFPSDYLHRADPVRSGTKYVFLIWLSGPEPIRWI